MRQIDQIILHCSDTPDSRPVNAAEIRRWHVEDNGWSDIGYHYVIRRDGCLELGRKLDTPGAHAKGHNRNSIGICLVGQERYTGKQWEQLIALVQSLLTRFPQAEVKGHNELSPKACPGFDVGEWLDECKREGWL